MFIGPERAQITRADVMASNGVLHVLDAVILPREALDLIDAARKSEGATFAKLVSQQEFGGADGLKDRLQSQHNLTVFVPSNQAFKELDADVWDELLKDSDKLEVRLM